MQGHETTQKAEPATQEDAEPLAAETRELKARLVAQASEIENANQRAAAYRAVFAGSPDAMVISNGEGLLIDFNESFERLLGYERSDLLGHSSDAISHADDIPVERALFGALIQRLRDYVDLEKRFRRKDGTWIWARVHAGAVFRKDGQVEAVFAIVKDSENELRAVTSVRAVDARNRALLDAVPDLLFVMTPDGRFLDCKPARDVPLMMPPSAFIGKHILDVMPPEIAKRQAEKVRFAAENNIASYDEYDLPTPDGVRHYAAIFARASTKEVVVSVRDITTRVEAERERDRLATAIGLKAEELLRWKTLADKAPDGILLAGLDRTILYANAAVESLFGRSDLEGRPARDLFAVPENIETIEATLRSHGHFRGELVFQRADKTSLPCDVVWFVIHNDEGKPTSVGAIIRDRTEARRAEEERLFLREQLIDAQQALIRELEAPLLPVGKGVLVMPIVGRMDASRAERLLGTLLAGITTYSARTVIMDITGVPFVDADVAEGLVRAASAAKLLGAETRLTGVSPAVARELVSHAEQIATLKPCSTLEQAVSLSLGLRNKR